MWDRQTEHSGQQFMGEGLAGKLSGIPLPPLPVTIISSEDFLRNYRAGPVLSKNTGKEQEKYRINIYENYDSAEKPDQRLPAMERAVDVRTQDLKKHPPFQ